MISALLGMTFMLVIIATIMSFSITCYMVVTVKRNRRSVRREARVYPTIPYADEIAAISVTINLIGLTYGIWHLHKWYVG